MIEMGDQAVGGVAASGHVASAALLPQKSI
jgi:hypothetical protein